MDIGEASIDAVVPEGEPRVVEPELVENRRVDIVNRGRVCAVEGLVAPEVALAVRHAALDAAPAKPVRKHERIVVAPFAALGRRHPAKLGRP